MWKAGESGGSSAGNGGEYNHFTNCWVFAFFFTVRRASTRASFYKTNTTSKRYDAGTDASQRLQVLNVAPHCSGMGASSGERAENRSPFWQARQ